MIVEIKRTCRFCKVEHELRVNDQDLERYQKGENVQEVFPYLSADDREIMISSICGKCFDKIFS